PIPTHTAYPVPTGISRSAYASPTMLSTSATPNTSDGTNRAKPRDSDRADAQTVSSTPDRTRTTHAMPHLRERRLVLPGTTRSSGDAADAVPRATVATGRRADRRW